MDSLAQSAVNVRQRAHAPYSCYKVGAAVETKDGAIIAGCNVESSSFGLTVCAERVALGAAVSQGHRLFKAMAVASVNGAPPCGACRQVIWDLCGDIPVTLIDERGNRTTVRSADLLPKPFDDQSLPGKGRQET